MEIKLVDMKPEHAAQLAQLWHQGWIDGHANVVPAELTKLRTLESFQDRVLENMTKTRVALRGEEVLGFTMVKAAELYQMYVGGAARGKGVASLLIEDAERAICASGHTLAWLSCAIGNERAARFYARQGWRNVGEETVALDTQGGSFPLLLWRFEKPLT
ncbi:GNAT family N-acetyltransferase [Planktotalea sp.]|uniref:GNAT family N-acetyltransferase n=1 Tax=Planktotalea sp. TaxID=2029877 RepID=UPI003D6A1B91